MSIARITMMEYLSDKEMAASLPKRKEFQDIIKDKFTVIDSFYYEGDITYFEASKVAEITTEWKT